MQIYVVPAFNFSCMIQLIVLILIKIYMEEINQQKIPSNKNKKLPTLIVYGIVMLASLAWGVLSNHGSGLGFIVSLIFLVLIIIALFKKDDKTTNAVTAIINTQIIIGIVIGLFFLTLLAIFVFGR